MNKWFKMTLIFLCALTLAACNNKNENDKAKVENAPEETTTTENGNDANESSQEAATTVEETTIEETENDAKGEEGTATITIHIDEDKTKEFEVINVGGVSVLDTMSAIKDLDYEFNEEEGVIDVIEGTENDYNPNTWMYLYNDQFAELGVVSQKLEDGDKIDWYFGSVEDIPVNIIPAE